MKEKLMEEKLKEIFNNVNEWLKFAEAKNGILIALVGTALLTLLDKSSDILFLDNISISNNIPVIKFDINFFVSIYLVLLMVFLVIAICIILISFLPQTKQVFKIKGVKTKNDNSIFYGDIIKYTPEEYLKFIEPNRTDFTKSELDYACQIVINSHIAYRKYKYFELALLAILSGILTVLGVFLVNRYFNPNK